MRRCSGELPNYPMRRRPTSRAFARKQAIAAIRDPQTRRYRVTGIGTIELADIIAILGFPVMHK